LQSSPQNLYETVLLNKEIMVSSRTMDEVAVDVIQRQSSMDVDPFQPMIGRGSVSANESWCGILLFWHHCGFCKTTSSSIPLMIPPDWSLVWSDRSTIGVT
jgi:hypothetical protein